MELLLLFMGQPDAGGHLISCTDVVTASALQHSKASHPSECVCMCGERINVCKILMTNPTDVQPKGCGTQLGFSCTTGVPTPSNVTIKSRNFNYDSRDGDETLGYESFVCV